MSKAAKQWIVRDPQGRISGPFTTELIFRHIDQGVLTGRETVALYPGGDWLPISKSPEFYDRLLDALAGEAADGAAREDATSVVSPQLEVREKTKSTNGSAGRTPPPQAVADDQVIELTDIKQLKKETQKRQLKAPLLMVVGAGALLVVALMMKTGTRSGRIHLLAPRSGQAAMSETSVRETYKRALQAFELDTFGGYLRAQDELVKIVEGAPKNMDGRALLCMTYRELWLYAAQDSQDQRTLTVQTQQARSIDPAGPRGALCDVVRALLRGQVEEAASGAESAVRRDAQTVMVFFYDIIGEIAVLRRNYPLAFNYFQTIRKVWPNWVKAYVMEAKMLSQDRRFSEALELLSQATQRSPEHVVSQIEAAVIEFEQFHHDDKAFDILNKALFSGEQMPHTVQSAGHFALAQVYFARTQRSRALAQAKEAYRLNPENHRAREMIRDLGGESGLDVGSSDGREQMFLGDQYYRQGDHFAAQAAYRVAFEQDRRNGRAAMMAGKSLWELSQSKDAIDWMKRAIEADPNLVEAYVTLADYYSQRFDYLSAIGVLKRSQTISPKNYEVYRGFAVVELRRNNFKGSLNFAKQALQLYDADSETNLVIARAYLGLEEYSEALRFCDRAIEMDIQNAVAHGLRARILASLKGADAAIQYLREKIQEYDRVVEYKLTLAEIYMREQRFRDAEATYGLVLSQEPNSKRALLGMGRAILVQTDRKTEALKLFLQAAVLDPSDAEAIYWAAETFVQQKRYPEAVKQYLRVLTLNPRFPRAHMSLGQAYLEMRDPKSALAQAETEKAMNPDLTEAYMLSGDAYYMLGAYSQCANQYQMALSKRAQRTEVYVRLARCYRRAGALDSAISVLRQAAARENGFADIWKEQGAVFHMKGQVDQAIESYERYKALAPNAKDTGVINRLIQKLQAGDFTLDEGDL